MPTIEEVTARLARAGHTVTFVSGPYRGEGSKSARYKGYITITATIDPPLPLRDLRFLSPQTLGVEEHAATRIEAENAVAKRLDAALDAVVEESIRAASATRSTVEHLRRIEREELIRARRYGASDQGTQPDIIEQAETWINEREEANRSMHWDRPSIEECLVRNLLDTIKSCAVTR